MRLSSVTSIFFRGWTRSPSSWRRDWTAYFVMARPSPFSTCASATPSPTLRRRADVFPVYWPSLRGGEAEVGSTVESLRPWIGLEASGARAAEEQKTAAAGASSAGAASSCTPSRQVSR